MEKLTTKLSILILLFAWGQLPAASLQLVSISPHTHDLYASSSPQVEQNREKSISCKTSCPKNLSLSEAYPNRQWPSQNGKNPGTFIGEIKADSLLSLSLLFLYIVSFSLLIGRIIRPALAKKTH